MKDKTDAILIKLDVERQGHKTLKTGVSISENTFEQTKVDIVDAAFMQFKREIEKSKILE